MSKLIVLIGLPGSGKSLIANNLQKTENAVIHSSDSLREELFGDINECSRNDELFKELHKRIKQDLLDGKNVIYDATNISYKKRKAFLDNFRKTNCYNECYFIATPYNQCLLQNNQRERKVPEYVINRMYKNIQIPQYYEGWDQIHITYNTNKLYTMEEIHTTLLELDMINHDNPHHTFTLGKHCRECAKNIEQFNDSELYWAALLHDIGKKFTKEFKNGKGEVTETAHYYQHHLVSAYDSLFLLMNLPQGAVLNITNYIQWHMQPFFMKEEKTVKKFINLVGQDFYDNLLLLHQADREAH